MQKDGLSIKVCKELLIPLRKQAAREQLRTGKFISVSELIRRAITDYLKNNAL